MKARSVEQKMIGFDPSDLTRFTPYQPFAFKIANKIVRLLDRVFGRVLAVNEQDLIRKARRDTGLHDFGDDQHLEPLRILCEHTRHGKPMTVFGRITARMDLRMRLQNKLKIHSLLTDNPEILQQPVHEPIFILGLPRTGTTLMHRLLAVDPGNRALRTWEMMHPVPPAGPETLDRDPGPWRVKSTMDLLDHVAPAVKMMHETRSDLPDECLFLMANGLVSGLYCTSWDSPYLGWFMKQDLTPAYQFHKKQLQLLQWKLSPRRWVLKAPWHLYSVESLLNVYPDARIVQLHRDPLEILPSLASLWTTLRAAMYEDVDPVAVGAEATMRASSLLNRGMEMRANEERKVGSRAVFQDVSYLEFVKNPIGTVAKIYEGFGLELSESATSNMYRYLEENRQGKYGKHRYQLEQFGLEAETQREIFRAYCERFEV